MNIDTNDALLNLCFENTLDALKTAMQQVDAFVDAHETAPKRAYAIRLAFEELTTNIIKYGYDDTASHQIDCCLKLGNQAVMTLTDDGHPFNPLEDAPAPTLDGALEDRPIGGLGLHMIQSMGMQLNYERIDGTNRLSVLFPDSK